MKKEQLQVLKDLKNLPNLNILIVEGGAAVVEGMNLILKEVYPAATIDTFSKEDFPFIEGIIKQKGYHLVILGGGRSQWPSHPIAGMMTSELIKVIKATTPEVKIMFVSTDRQTVEMMKERGADVSYPKDDFGDLLSI